MGSLDLVEFLGGLAEQDSMLLQAAAQTLEEINAQDQPALANALQETVVGILRSRMPRRAAGPTAAAQRREPGIRD